jgi:FkbM family methyltransferase
MLRRLGYRIAREWRIRSKRDFVYKVGGLKLVLPPGHLLPYHQRRDPLYDRYFLPFFRRLGERGTPPFVFDIGANVGDTALAIFSVCPHARVVSVEGSPFFLRYLRKNLEPFENARIVESFVTHRLGSFSLSSDGSTGHLVAHDSSLPSDSNVAQIAPAYLLAEESHGMPTIWKSDTDGYDIPILLGSFEKIVSSCDAIWIEFDPLGNFTGREDVEALIRRLETVDRQVVVFDNFGNRIMRMPSGQSAPMMRNLVHWLSIQHQTGSQKIHYLDVWLLEPDLADLLCGQAE